MYKDHQGASRIFVQWPCRLLVGDFSSAEFITGIWLFIYK